MKWKEELESLEHRKLWSDAVVFIKKTTEKNRDDVEVYVRAIYLLLNLLLEEDYAAHNLEHDSLAKLLRQYFDDSYKRFRSSAEYLFFTGYFMGIAEWYFGQDTLDLSHQMLKKATELEPENALYEWAYKFALGDELAGYLSKKIIADSEKMKWLESKGSPGEYIINVIRSCSEGHPIIGSYVHDS
jgi:S-ribosylhomocysteine lyase LuxS involved in autoinducer biosynthesis